MDLEPLRQFCQRGDLENVKKICSEAKLTKEIIFYNEWDYSDSPFDFAYLGGHLDVCRYFTLNFNITQEDIYSYSTYYFGNIFFNYCSCDMLVKYVTFLIEEFGIIEDDLKNYIEKECDETRKKVLECFKPFGSCTKPAKF